MLALACAAMLTTSPTPLTIDAIAPEYARSLNGRLVVASFVVGKPPMTYPGTPGETVIGAADLDEVVERGAILRGRRFDIEEGKRFTVVGRMRVIDHPAGFVGDVLVLAWAEVRVEEVRK